MAIKQIKAKVPCDSCNGTGRIPESWSAGSDWHQEADGCSACGGEYHIRHWGKSYTSSGRGWNWKMVDDPKEVQRLADEKRREIQRQQNDLERANKKLDEQKYRHVCTQLNRVSVQQYKDHPAFADIPFVREWCAFLEYAKSSDVKDRIQLAINNQKSADGREWLFGNNRYGLIQDKVWEKMIKLDVDCGYPFKCARTTYKQKLSSADQNTFEQMLFNYLDAYDTVLDEVWEEGWSKTEPGKKQANEKKKTTPPPKQSTVTTKRIYTAPTKVKTKMIDGILPVIGSWVFIICFVWFIGHTIYSHRQEKAQYRAQLEYEAQLYLEQEKRDTRLAHASSNRRKHKRSNTQ